MKHMIIEHWTSKKTNTKKLSTNSEHVPQAG